MFFEDQAKNISGCFWHWSPKEQLHTMLLLTCASTFDFLTQETSEKDSRVLQFSVCCCCFIIFNLFASLCHSPSKSLRIFLLIQICCILNIIWFSSPADLQQVTPTIVVTNGGHCLGCRSIKWNDTGILYPMVCLCQRLLAFKYRNYWCILNTLLNFANNSRPYLINGVSIWLQNDWRLQLLFYCLPLTDASRPHLISKGR